MPRHEEMPDDFAEELHPELREFAWDFHRMWEAMPEEWQWVMAQQVIKGLPPAAIEKLRREHPELFES